MTHGALCPPLPSCSDVWLSSDVWQLRECGHLSHISHICSYIAWQKRRKTSCILRPMFLLVQMSGSERVSAADVALFNGWREEQTRELTSKAWTQLQARVQGQLASWRSLVGLRQAHQVWVRWLYAASDLGLSTVEVAAQWYDRLYSASEGTQAQAQAQGSARAQADVQAQTFGAPQSEALEWSTRLLGAYHRRAHFLEDPAAVKLAIHFAAAGLAAQHPGAHRRAPDNGASAQAAHLETTAEEESAGGWSVTWTPAAAGVAGALLDEFCGAAGIPQGNPVAEEARGLLLEPQSAIGELVDEAVRDQLRTEEKH